FFFFSSRRRHTRFSRDWSSDVCSSDLYHNLIVPPCVREVFVLLGQIAGLGGPRDPGNQPLSRLIGSFADPTFWKTFSASAAVVLIAAAALLFDTMTSRVVSVDFFYVAILLVAFWYPSPKAPLILAPLASILIIVGLWLAIPDNVPMWENWLNRLSA